MDGVAVIIVKDENVIAAADGWYNKTTSLVRPYLASDGLAVGVDVVCPMIRTLLKSGWLLRCGGCLLLWRRGKCW